MHTKSFGRMTLAFCKSLWFRKALLLWAFLCLAPIARGDTLIWNGAGATGKWSDSGNWFGVTPTNGDILVFQGGQPKPINTNDIAGLTLNQIRFIGTIGGYTILGNSFALSNTVRSIEATNTTGINTISNNITVPFPNLVINVAPAAKLILSGALSGPGGVVKNGAGTNLLAGASSNTYGGATTVNAGLMELQKNGIVFTATAIPSDLIIGDGVNAATVRNLEPEDIADSANVTINQLGLWDLNTRSETIGNHLTNSGTITTETATLTLSPSPFITVPPGAGATISGNFNINSGTCTIQNDGNLELQAAVSGSADIVKNGGGHTHFGNANTFTGSFTANGGGYVWVTHPLGLGATNGATTLNGSTLLYVSGNITITNEPLILNTTYASGALNNYAADTNVWTGPVTFSSDATIFVVANGSLSLRGPLSGPAGFVKLGPGVLTLAGPPGTSSYAGNTTLNEGILLLNSINVIRFGTLTIGDGLGGTSADVVRYLSGGCIYGGTGGSTVVVRSSGLLDLNGFTDDVGPIAMDGGQILTGSGTLQLFQPFNTYHTDPTNGASIFNGNLELIADSTFGISNNLTISGVLSSSGNYALTKNGFSHLYLLGNNTYTGPTIIQQGWLHAESPTALGAATSGTIVSNNASLVLEGSSFGITNEAVTLNGNGAASDWGALDIETSGTNIWAGPITVNADSMVTAYGALSNLRIIGAIGGPAGVTTLPDGSGNIYFEGNVSNSYAGVTRVLGGTLLLNKAFTDGAIPGNVVVGSTLRLLQSQQINNVADVLVQGGGLFDFGAQNEFIDTLHGSGSITFATFGWLDIGFNNGSSTFDGLMSGVGYPGGYTVGKWGTGTFTLTGNNAYLNQSHAFAGTLVINGVQPQSSAYVENGATFRGAGTVGEIFCAGHLRPGNSPGILTCSNLTFTSTATYHEEISGRVPGLGYDQMNVRGTNNLANAALAITVPLSNAVSVGDQLVMINNDGADAITGNFLGWPPGSSFSANGFTFVISYAGGSGNDVVLNVTSIPGDVLSSSVAAGNGDHLIGPNECNNFSIVITNKTGTPMTGVTAVLSTTTAGVEITQPYSSYPNVPANGKATNGAPFQISTLPSFSCGTDINLQLSVHPLSHGAFTVPFVIHSGAPDSIPVRFDNSTITNIPDVGSIESTNVVSAFNSILAKVAVSIWLTHPVDSDLSLSLISPNGTTVNLTSGNGGGANFGAGCSPDANRTTFDDAGLVSITAGSPPFVGTFRPQTPLSAFFETPSVNGSWRLHITDSFGGSVGALRCWSLFLYPITCAPGSGLCAYCLPPITGSITNTDLVEPSRISRNGLVASCGTLKAFPTTLDNNLHYDTYTVSNNSGADACVTIELAAICDVQAIAYLGNFDTNNLANNYLGDSGASTASGAPGTNSFSCMIPAGTNIVVVVNEIISGAGCNNYTLSVSGLPCPPPSLSVQDLPGPNARVFWPNSAGGYLLESSPLVQPTAWSVVTNEPIINGGNYNITNRASGPRQFYRLHKP
jgi:autotransporter-associated beta strand protein